MRLYGFVLVSLLMGFSMTSFRDGSLFLAKQKNLRQELSVTFDPDSAPTVEWSKTYERYRDGAWSVVETDDRGYVLVGTTYSLVPSFGRMPDLWLVKTDLNGDVQWNKTYGGRRADWATDIIYCADGGYAIAGFTKSFVEPHFGRFYEDAWLVKTDAHGNPLWNQTYGGIKDDRTVSIVQTEDGGYALAGFTFSFGDDQADFWIVKTDANGNVQWNNTYGGLGRDYATSIIQTHDGGYALAGTTESAETSLDFWLVKTDANGNHEWNRTFGGDKRDDAWALVHSQDGGYVLAGVTESFTQNKRDAWLVRTDADGNMQWNKTYGNDLDNGAWSLIQTRDGGYAFAGFTGKGNLQFDALVVKINADGNMQWNMTVGEPNKGELHEYGARSIIQTSDGGYALAGFANLLDEHGDVFWLAKLGPEQSTSLIFWLVQNLPQILIVVVLAVVLFISIFVIRRKRIGK